ncbi:MAG TPA: arylsulfotransferase family protein [Gemmatimonadaceae bacterium]|nr:arylsulfotransferase family protein [Gemmatimonadaceae bacterium]
MRQAGRRKALCVLALLACGCSGTDAPFEPDGCAPPQVLRSDASPNTNNVLSAIVTAEVLAADTIAVRFGHPGATLDSITPVFPPGVSATGLPVLGLEPDMNYALQVVAFNDCATVHGELLTLTTGALPSDLPVYSASGPAPSPGYVAFAAGSYGLVIDNSGRVVWYHRFPDGPGLNFQAQANGRYVARPPPATAGEAAQWLEVDPLGNTTRTLGCVGGLQPRVHDFLGEADGAYWLMCDEVRTMDLSSAGGASEARVLGTAVQHIAPSGDLLFHWSPFERLSIDLNELASSEVSASMLNWTHGNALDLDGDGNLLLSFRNLSTIVKIDTQTGAVAWHMGGSRNEFTFENTSMPAFAGQHSVRATGPARLLLLDNIGDPSLSRAERYEYDEAMRRARLTDAYVSSRTGVVARLGGTAQDLPGARTLVSFGNGASVEEFDAAGNVVWRMDGDPGYVFRAQRIRSLYSPGAGDPR